MTHIGRDEKVFDMRIFLSILIIIFSLQSWTKADDISEFEISGISIKDKIEKFLKKNEIKRYKRKIFKTDEYITLQFEASLLNSDEYDLIEINFKNPILIVESISGIKFFKNVNNCFKQQDEIISSLNEMFLNNKKVNFIDKKVYVHGADTSGKSTYTRASFMFSKGDKISIDCNHYSQKFINLHKVDHQLYVAIDTKEFDDFLGSGRAY